jgi:cell wall-associated NlpC family hydrolase
MTGSRTRQSVTARTVALLLAASAVVAVLLTATTAQADPSIGSKQAEAQQVLAQMAVLERDIEQQTEAYDGARAELQNIDADLATNTKHLAIAKESLGTAQTTIASRLRALYVNGPGSGTVEVLLGAKNLDDVLSRLDVVERVGSQDAKVLADVKRFQKEVRERHAKLQSARARQAEVVAAREAAKRDVEAKLAEHQRLYESVKAEIQRLQAQERQRQVLLAAQARARLEAARIAANTTQAISTESVAVDPGTTTVSAEDPSIPAPPPARYTGVVGIAMQYLGVPYVWGGMSPSGFDCSGFVAYVYSQVGVSLPHHAASQYGYGVAVSRDQLAPGDLVFFDGLGHVGMYIGGGQFIHAPHTGDVVKISSLYDSWYASNYVGARRIL